MNNTLAAIVYSIVIGIVVSACDQAHEHYPISPSVTEGVVKPESRPEEGNSVAKHKSGLNKSGKIEGVVWLDLDGDGLRDGHEPGIAGVEILLTVVETNTQCGKAGVRKRSRVTNRKGRYHFAGLPTGEFEVRLNLETLPPGMTVVNNTGTQRARIDPPMPPERPVAVVDFCLALSNP